MRASPHNPYIAGNPVGDSMAFVGRTDVLRTVMRVLRHDQQNAIVLYGQRRIGKTSVLQHLRANLAEEGPYYPVYFDLQDKAALSLDRVLQDLARAIAQALNQPMPDLGSEAAATFRDEWLPGVLDALPEGCSVVLLLDEFDVLADAAAEQAAKAFFPYLREMLASDPARLKFHFVIGRNIDDLDNIALSVFKGTPARRISLLSQEDCATLVRLSEANGSLTWLDDGVARVWELTNGHPFLTQSLCSHVWERAYDLGPAETPSVAAADVDAAVPEALDASRNTMEWLWAGLPPAERVVASTLAEAGSTALAPEALERLLHDAGVRVVIRELQSAPALLQDWDLIEPTDGGFRFRVELLRRWIAENKPLRRVQEELDYVEPVAENLYQAAMGLYQAGQLDGAIDLLRRAVALNPNHVRANQLLADNLLARDSAGEAVELLDRLYQYQPSAARPRLVQALLCLAQDAGTPEEALEPYERVLALDPIQPEATAGRRRIWQQRGDAAWEAGDLDAAIRAYETAGSAESVRKVKDEQRRQNLRADLQMLEKAEQGGAFTQALELARTLAQQYPDDRDWAVDLARLERRSQLKDLYQRGLGALHSGDPGTAQGLLAQVVGIAPDYEEATRYLHLAVTGVDPGKPPASATGETPPAPAVPPTAAAAGVSGEEVLVAPNGEEAVAAGKAPHLLKLAWLLVARPDQYKAHRKALGQVRERQLGTWLASGLTFLPLLLLFVKATLSTGLAVIAPVICVLAAVLVGGLGAWGRKASKPKRWRTWAAGAATFVVVGFAVLIAMRWVRWNYYLVVGIGGAPLSVGIGGALGVAVALAPGVVAGAAAGAFTASALSATFAYRFQFMTLVAVLAGLVLAAILGRGLRKGLEAGRHSLWVYGAFVLMAISYLVGLLLPL